VTVGLRPEELWSRFDWASGNCFKCDQVGVLVAEVGEISVAGSPALPLHACRPCVFRLEQLHWTRAERAKRPPRAASRPGPQSRRPRVARSLLTVRQLRTMQQRPGPNYPNPPPCCAA